MKSIYKKKLEKAAVLIREVFDDLEAEDSGDFDAYGTKLDDLAGELEDVLMDVEDKSGAATDDDEEYDPE